MEPWFVFIGLILAVGALSWVFDKARKAELYERLMADTRDIQTDLFLLGVQRKALLLVKTIGGYSSVVLDEEEYSSLVVGRTHFEAKEIRQVIRLTRVAVEEGKI